jgi:multidrug transporter EmrE-like cation transporter
MLATIGLLAGFFAFQVAANLLFKYGTVHPDRYWSGFILGNALGISSIWFMMNIYQRMNANVGMAIACGGSFVLVQLALFVLFDGRLTGLQWAGLITILVGITITTLGGTSATTA